MGRDLSEQEFLKKFDPEQYKKPAVMVDISIFTIKDDRLQVLLVRRGGHPFKGMWSLPGGAVHVDRSGKYSFDESLDDAAKRELYEETGVEARYLEQVMTYGDATRDPRQWTLSVSYFALMDSSSLMLQHGSDASEAKWHAIHDYGVRAKLGFDHKDLLKDAIRRLRSKVEYTAIAACLLPQMFTLPQLKHVYEILLQEAVPNKSFRRRIEDSDIIVPLPGQYDESDSGKKGRKALLYRYNPKKEQSLFFPRSIVRAEAERHGTKK